MAGIIKHKKEIIEKYQEFRRNYLEYAKIIKNIAKEVFQENFLKIIVFGSILSKKYRVDSDIDIAIILKEESKEEERIAFYKEIRNKLGFLHPFEFHIVSEYNWENWYKKFIKEFLEV
jgi:predicted nucleotidyltransferase